MLWWLFSGWSRDRNQPWNDVATPATPLIAAKEAADLTEILPGPASITAFLDKTIRSGNSKLPANLSIRESINALPLDWRNALAEARNVPALEQLAPLLRGIKLSCSAPNNDGWLPAFEQETGIPQQSRMAPVSLSYQLYQEILLHRAWAATPE